MHRMLVEGSGMQSFLLFSVSPDRMSALEEFIMISPNATPIAKKTLLWMLRQTKGLSLPVSLMIPPLDDDPPDSREDLSNKESLGFSAQVAYSVHDMNSSGGKTHLHLFFRGMGSPMHFSSHCGRYLGRAFDSKAGGHTIWIAAELYGWGGFETYRHLPFDRETILSTPDPKRE